MFKAFFGTAKVPELELKDNLLKLLAVHTINERIAVTGVQPKLFVTLDRAKGKNRLTIVGLWGEYILKPRYSSFSECRKEKIRRCIWLAFLRCVCVSKI